MPMSRVRFGRLAAPLSARTAARVLMSIQSFGGVPVVHKYVTAVSVRNRPVGCFTAATRGETRGGDAVLAGRDGSGALRRTRFLPTARRPGGALPDQRDRL